MAYSAVLDSGLQALRLELGEETRRAIDDHVRLVLAWNAAINLTGIRDPVAVATEHVLDSLTALELLADRGVDRLLDLGSGGGFPGIPLALALPAEALLVESIAKKARFLRTAADAIGAAQRIDVAATRAEELARSPTHRGHWPAVVARAVARLAELAELGLPLLRTGGVLVAWKRRPLDTELADAIEPIRACGGGPPLFVGVRLAELSDHVLVVVEKVAATPAAYPREPTQRRADTHAAAR